MPINDRRFGPMNGVKIVKKKKKLPAPGRKLSAKEARELANKQFAKTLAMLAK
jgi:hypothetical protein